MACCGTARCSTHWSDTCGNAQHFVRLLRTTHHRTLDSHPLSGVISGDLDGLGFDPHKEPCSCCAPRRTTQPRTPGGGTYAVATRPLLLAAVCSTGLTLPIVPIAAGADAQVVAVTAVSGALVALIGLVATIITTRLHTEAARTFAESAARSEETRARAEAEYLEARAEAERIRAEAEADAARFYAWAHFIRTEADGRTAGASAEAERLREETARLHRETERLQAEVNLARELKTGNVDSSHSMATAADERTREQSTQEPSQFGSASPDSDTERPLNYDNFNNGTAETLDQHGFRPDDPDILVPDDAAHRHRGGGRPPGNVSTSAVKRRRLWTQAGPGPKVS